MRLSINDTELYFDVEGAALVPDGPDLRGRPAMLVLHGGPGYDHAYFKPAPSTLVDAAQIVYLDQRGQGRSARVPVQSCTVEQMADDAAVFCRTLGIERPNVLGHSYGGDVSGEAMERFGRLVTPAYVHSPEKAGPVLETWGRSTFTQEVASHFFGNLAALYDVRERLGEISVPTLVMVGKSDWLIPPSASRVIAEGIPGAELVVIPEAGYLSLVERPEVYADAVRRFLSTSGSRA